MCGCRSLRLNWAVYPRHCREEISPSPLIPVSRPSLGPEELAAVRDVFESGWLGLGQKTYDFEEVLKSYLGCRDLVAVSSGTAALHLALEAFGVGPGDEVIVPSLTFVSSVQAILAAGAMPVFCESRETDLSIDVEDVRRRMTPRTRAVMPVHFCGNPCEMTPLLALAHEHGFWVVEDAAHAFGSFYNGRRIGSFGHATCFSFDPVKNLTCGEGGAIALQDEEVALTLRRKRVLGLDRDRWRRGQTQQSSSYEVTMRGYRYHMPNFCAAIGLTQIKRVDEFIRRRKEICRRYDRAFSALSSLKILLIDYDSAAPHLYAVRVGRGRRNAFMEFLRARGIETAVHYPPNHLQPFFRTYSPEELPGASRLGEEIVSLPLFYDLEEFEIQAVIAAVLKFEAAVEKEEIPVVIPHAAQG